MLRAEVTEKILSAKRLKKLSWKTICAEIGGGSPVYLTAALLGQMKLRPEQADARRRAVRARRGRDAAAAGGAVSRLAADAVPTDPLIYRFYELVQGLRHRPGRS